MPNWFDAPWRGFDTGVYPQMAPNALAAGDLDGDGDADVVVGRNFTGSFSSPRPGVSVLLNHGDGTYDLPVHYNLPNPPLQPVGEVALADIDADGTLDVLATIRGQNGQGNRLAVWRNRGDGTLTGLALFATGQGPVGIVVADFSGDGFVDVATANYGRGFSDSSTVSLLVHNGLKGPSAGFLAPSQVRVGSDPLRVAAADLNGDGWTDLAVGRVRGTLVNALTIVLNDGAGNLGASMDYLLSPPGQGGSTGAVALADLDQDGDYDLIGGNGLDLAVRLNPGDGLFGPETLYRLPAFASSPALLRVADLNGDGLPDLLGTIPNGRATDGWLTFLGDGAGGFLPGVVYEASKQTFEAIAADVDLDGDQDVLTVANDSTAITVHANPGDGIFPVLPRYAVGSLTNWLDAADLDLDGDLDIVTTDEQVRILLNQGDGTFAPALTYRSPLRHHDVKLRDLNNDGYPDLILGPNDRFPPYHLVTALNNGDGTFVPGVVTVTNSCGYGRVEAGDFDNDGDNDVVMTEERGCFGGGLPRIFLYENDGAGRFTLLPPLLSTVGFANSIAIADLDFDGNLDLVSSIGQGIAVWRGNGDRTFQEPLVSGTRAYQFALTDMNLDGLLDMVLLVPQDAFGTVFIGVSLGNGDGTFQRARTVAGTSGLEGAFRISNDIDVGDVNLDGYPDVVVSNNASNDISLFLNNGDGTLGIHQRYGAGYGATAAFVGDFSGDGVLDVAPFIALPPSGLGNAVVLVRGLGGLQPVPGPTGSTVQSIDFDQALVQDHSHPRLASITVSSASGTSKPWEIVLVKAPRERDHSPNPECVERTFSTRTRTYGGTAWALSLPTDLGWLPFTR